MVCLFCVMVRIILGGELICVSTVLLGYKSDASGVTFCAGEPSHVPTLAHVLIVCTLGGCATLGRGKSSTRLRIVAKLGSALFTSLPAWSDSIVDGGYLKKKDNNIWCYLSQEIFQIHLWKWNCRRKESNSINIACSFGIWKVAIYISIVFQWRTNVPRIFTIRYPSPAHWRFGVSHYSCSWRSKGSVIKINSPNTYVYTEIFELTLVERKRFNVTIVCWISWSHWDKGKSGSTKASPALKYCLKVWIARYAKFIQWACGETRWCLILFFNSAFFKSLETSLSITHVVGLIAVDSKFLLSFSQAAVIFPAFRFFKDCAKIALAS